MKRNLLLAAFVMITVLVLQAQEALPVIEKGPVERLPEFGLLLGFASSGMDHGYSNDPGGKLGVYGRWQIARTSDLSAELHLQTHKVHRFVPRPYPYVIGMRETVSTLKLRLPVSILLLSDSPKNDTHPFLGAGLYLDTPIYCRRTEERDLISETQTYTENVTEHYPPATLGMQIRMGGKFGRLTAEFRFSSDLISMELPWINQDRFTHFDAALILGLALN